MKNFIKFISIFSIIFFLGAGCSDANTVSNGEKKVFEITAKQWEFDPSVITVNKGDTVELVITSTDGAHGLAIPAFRVNKDVGPGKTETLTFVADKSGTFEIRCSIPCGPGHVDMVATLIVN